MNTHSIHLLFEQCDCLAEGRTKCQIKQPGIWRFSQLSCPMSLTELGSRRVQVSWRLTASVEFYRGTFVQILRLHLCAGDPRLSSLRPQCPPHLNFSLPSPGLCLPREEGLQPPSWLQIVVSAIPRPAAYPGFEVFSLALSPADGPTACFPSHCGSWWLQALSPCWGCLWLTADAL